MSRLEQMKVVYIALGLTSMECMSRLEQMMFISSVLLGPSQLCALQVVLSGGAHRNSDCGRDKIAKAAWRRFCHSVHVE